MAASITAPDTRRPARDPLSLNHPVAGVKRHKKPPALAKCQDELESV